MGFLDQLKSAFKSASTSDPYVMWVYVKCKRCGTPVAVRVDLRNDPSLDDEGAGYILRKEIMDDKCFTLMRAELKFNSQRKIAEQTIDKGEFITREEYEAMKNNQ